MASAVDSRLAYARLSAVATASRLHTATRGSNNSYTTSWDTTGGQVGGAGILVWKTLLELQQGTGEVGHFWASRGHDVHIMLYH